MKRSQSQTRFENKINMATVESMVVEEQREPEKPVDREKVVY